LPTVGVGHHSAAAASSGTSSSTTGATSSGRRSSVRVRRRRSTRWGIIFLVLVPAASARRRFPRGRASGFAARGLSSRAVFFLLFLGFFLVDGVFVVLLLVVDGILEAYVIVVVLVFLIEFGTSLRNRGSFASG